MSEPGHDMHSASGNEAAGEPFAVLLRRLIGLRKLPDGRPYTVADVDKDLNRDQKRISKSHLYGLVNGTSEPSLEVTQTLADYFGVELEYFGKGTRARALQNQYALLEKLSHEGVQEVAFRASELSGDQLRSVLDFIEFQTSRKDDPDNTSG
ncbi:helix-turn-helix domain-containing protein [Amycolatopsis umgeniensis]|uniref:Transcriptional regulator with XRE-family HTH domain n=1 Tax=Amycolatopsis umgeniensis TaxID=336628 RepID=A0A841BC36_9PSEU|nr:transcriptional regulator with XRE-family HTH domain [Amycolatopsis umgeniensis]